MEIKIAPILLYRHYKQIGRDTPTHHQIEPTKFCGHFVRILSIEYGRRTYAKIKGWCDHCGIEVVYFADYEDDDE